jgi:peptide-methionine (S)-S-oxide reductase
MPSVISTDNIVAIHLHTHSCASNHSMRHKYRSAIYTFSKEQQKQANLVLQQLSTDFNERIITKTYMFNACRASSNKIKNYYYDKPDKTFCQTIINPKLKKLLKHFRNKVNL